jgi:hypothetical protein
MKKQVPAGTPKPPDETLQPGSLVFTPPGRAVDVHDLSRWWTWTNGASWRHPQGPGSTVDGKDGHPVVQQLGQLARLERVHAVTNTSTPGIVSDGVLLWFGHSGFPG